MKSSLLATAAFVMLAVPAWADDPSALITMKDAIKGQMTIEFGTRTNTRENSSIPADGAADVYKTNLEVANSIIFQGTIKRQPWIPNQTFGTTHQPGFLNYDLAVSLRNPAKPDQTVNLGKWVGAMILDGNGLYSAGQPPEGYDLMQMAMIPVGKIPGFTKMFSGQIQGKIPEQAGLFGLVDRASKAIDKTYSRVVNGKLVQTVVKGADPMEFKQTGLAQGPLSLYPDTVFNGSIDYDGNKGNWFIDATASYNLNGKQVSDHYTGTIGWNPDPNRPANGKGNYTVNVRLNEQPPTTAETDAFTPSTSESDFYAADQTVPGFTGSIVYQDTFMPGSSDPENPTTKSSDVTYHIDGNQVSKIQIVDFAKVILLIVGPFNDD